MYPKSSRTCELCHLLITDGSKRLQANCGSSVLPYSDVEVFDAKLQNYAFDIVPYPGGIRKDMVNISKKSDQTKG